MMLMMNIRKYLLLPMAVIKKRNCVMILLTKLLKQSL